VKKKSRGWEEKSSKVVFKTIIAQYNSEETQPTSVLSGTIKGLFTPTIIPLSQQIIIFTNFTLLLMSPLLYKFFKPEYLKKKKEIR
jgi:hypothetical protein